MLFALHSVPILFQTILCSVVCLTITTIKYLYSLFPLAVVVCAMRGLADAVNCVAHKLSGAKYIQQVQLNIILLFYLRAWNIRFTSRTMKGRGRFTERRMRNEYFFVLYFNDRVEKCVETSVLPRWFARSHLNTHLNGDKQLCGCEVELVFLWFWLMLCCFVINICMYHRLVYSFL